MLLRSPRRSHQAGSRVRQLAQRRRAQQLGRHGAKSVGEHAERLTSPAVTRQLGCGLSRHGRAPTALSTEMLDEVRHPRHVRIMRRLRSIIA